MDQPEQPEQAWQYLNGPDEDQNAPPHIFLRIDAFMQQPLEMLQQMSTKTNILTELHYCNPRKCFKRRLVAVVAPGKTLFLLITPSAMLAGAGCKCSFRSLFFYTHTFTCHTAFQQGRTKEFPGGCHLRQDRQAIPVSLSFKRAGQSRTRLCTSEAAHPPPSTP